METYFKILDCTLRDGGYKNNWNFSEKEIDNLLKLYKEVPVDMIEYGYLRPNQKASGTIFSSINQFVQAIPLLKEKKTFLMYDFDPNWMANHFKGLNENIGIRITFKHYEYSDIFELISFLTSLSPYISVQIMNTKDYSKRELLYLLTQLNEKEVFAVAIVDSFGNITAKELIDLSKFFSENLSQKINLGIHLHSNTQDAVKTLNDAKTSLKHLKRNIIIDTTYKGIGRGAGNLRLSDGINTIYRNKKAKILKDNILDFEYDCSHAERAVYKFIASQNLHPNIADVLINERRELFGKSCFK